MSEHWFPSLLFLLSPGIFQEGFYEEAVPATVCKAGPLACCGHGLFVFLWIRFPNVGSSSNGHGCLKENYFLGKRYLKMS